MALKALILDDEAQSRSALSQKLQLFCPEITSIQEASTVDEAWPLLTDSQPDILFLDIHLGGEVGFELLERLSDDQPEWSGALIFVTAHEAYALKAIKFSALDYLLKPIDPEELVRAVRKVEEGVEDQSASINALRSNLQTSEKKLVIASSDGMYIVRVSDILRCESTSNYTQFFLKSMDKRLVASKTLKEYEQMLDSHGFERVHKSHLVNMECVKRYVTSDGGYLILEDGSTVPVANRKKESLVSLLKSM